MGKRGNNHETTMKKQTTGWGYGKEIYRTCHDFPNIIHFEGEDGYKMCECMTTNVGMTSAEYYVAPDDDSRRVYLDAAENKTRG